MSNNGASAHEAAGGHTRKRSRRRKGRGPLKNGQKSSESMAEMIDRLLGLPVEITVRGEQERTNALKAIMFQLFQKAFSGSDRAKRVLLKYKEFATKYSDKRLRLTFIDNDYTRAVSTRLGGDNE